jgi:catechol 2,3-dioxygenase-like lactoylglutathione lyase family enzyme
LKEEDRMVKVSGILETAIYVDDLSRAAAFYRRLFGFETLLENERIVALNVAGRNVLLLFPKGASTSPTVLPGGVIPPHDGSGQLHAALRLLDRLGGLGAVAGATAVGGCRDRERRDLAPRRHEPLLP